MKFVKDDEHGFLLLESLITLAMIASILFLIYPMLVNWMSIRNEAKNEIELARVFYESSMEWNNSQSKKEWVSNSYKIKATNQSLLVSDNEQNVEVIIYGYEFE